MWSRTNLGENYSMTSYWSSLIKSLGKTLPQTTKDDDGKSDEQNSMKIAHENDEVKSSPQNRAAHNETLVKLSFQIFWKCDSLARLPSLPTFSLRLNPIWKVFASWRKAKTSLLCCWCTFCVSPRYLSGDGRRMRGVESSKKSDDDGKLISTFVGFFLWSAARPQGEVLFYFFVSLMWLYNLSETRNELHFLFIHFQRAKNLQENVFLLISYSDNSLLFPAICCRSL